MGKLEGKIALIIPILWINSAFKKKLSLRTIVKQSCIVRDCFVAALLAMTALIYAQSNNRIGITGGNSGIGLATAKQFVNEGAYVFITGRRDPELAAAV